MNTFRCNHVEFTHTALGLLTKLGLTTVLIAQLIGCTGTPTANEPLPEIAGCTAIVFSFITSETSLSCDSVAHLDQLPDNANFSSLDISPSVDAKNLDLSRFTQLNKVRIINDTLETLTLRLHASFSSVSIEAAHLTKLQLPVKVLELSLINSPALLQLNTSTTKIPHVNITGPLNFNLGDLFAHAGIQNLSVRNNNFKNLNLRVLTYLETAYFEDTDFNSADLSTLTQLTSLTLAEGDMTSLDLRNTTIKFIDLQNSNISSLYLANEGPAGTLTVLAHKAESLTIIGGEGFHSVYMRDGALKSVDLSSMRSLDGLTLDDMQLDTINLPDNSTFSKFGGINCPVGALTCTVITH